MSTKKFKLLPVLPLSSRPTRVPPTPHNPAHPHETNLELLSQVQIWKYLPIEDIIELCKTKKYMQFMCQNTYMWEYLLKRDFRKEYQGTDAKHRYFKYYRIIKFFTKLFPVITDIALDAIYAYVPETMWDELAQTYTMGEYYEILDTSNLCTLITEYLGELDSAQCKQIETFVKGIFRRHINVSNMLNQDSRLSCRQIVRHLEKIFQIPGTLYLRGIPITLPFNWELIELTSYTVFNSSCDGGVFYEDLYGKAYEIIVFLVESGASEIPDPLPSTGRLLNPPPAGISLPPPPRFKWLYTQYM